MIEKDADSKQKDKEMRKKIQLKMLITAMQCLAILAHCGDFTAAIVSVFDIASSTQSISTAMQLVMNPSVRHASIHLMLFVEVESLKATEALLTGFMK